MENKKSATAAEDERNEGRQPHPPLSRLAAPWLVIPLHEGEGNCRNQAFYNICEPNNKTCRRSIPELSGVNTFYQKPSHQGWLVIRQDNYKSWNDVCFLWNPLSLETIKLPSLVEFLDDIYEEDDDYGIHDCVLSSPPPHDNDSMVYFLVKGGFDLIVYCRVGDANWRMLEIPQGIVGEEGYTSALIFLEDKLYVMCCDDNCLLVVEKLPPSSGDYGAVSLGITRLEVGLDHSDFRYIGGNSCVASVYFLESYGEIYRIEMVCLDKRGHLDLVVSVNVAKLDFTEMSWKEVNSLGDTVLFLSENTNASCSAAELGLRKGCLYYTLPVDHSLYIIDVEDRCTTTILPCSELPMPWFSSHWIVIPLPTDSVTGGESIREKMSSKVVQHDSTTKAKEMERIISGADFEILRIKQNEEALEQPRPWVLVNEDILSEIAKLLHLVDCLHFRAVCKTNRTMIPIPKQISGPIRNTYITPWLLFLTENAAVLNFVDPVHNNEKYSMRLPEVLAGAIIRGQKGGWLLMSKGRFTVFFYNPFTKETIQLPKFPTGYCVAGISFSSLPTCSDCVVFGVTQQNNDEEISIYITERGLDRWGFDTLRNSDLKRFMPTFNEPVFHKGAFYWVDFNGTLGVFSRTYLEGWKVLEMPSGFSNAPYISFLVDCEGELLLVQILMSVTIFRLDEQNLVWQKVDSLGKHMLFISFTSCLSAVAPKSWMENKVYFPRLHDERILYYSLETGHYHAVGSNHSSKDYYDTKSWTNCTWIEPNWSRFTSQELDWLNKNPR